MSLRGVAFILIGLGLTAAAAGQTPAPAAGAMARPENGQVLRLWSGAAPGAMGTTPADIPTLTAYLPAEGAGTGAMFIVCPGGGYLELAEHEGKPVAEWLRSLGVAAFVLRYRLGPRYHYPAPQEDAARAIRYLRDHAAEWGLDGRRLGILGFSAGGHVAATAGTHFDYGAPASPDPVERQSSRPDLMVLVYPVISMIPPYAHGGSRRALLGAFPAPGLARSLSDQTQVERDTPPAFLVATSDDPVVPVQNSLMFASALKSAGVPFELHIYQHGPHGFGLADASSPQPNPVLATWKGLCATWLREHRFAR